MTRGPATSSIVLLIVVLLAVQPLAVELVWAQVGPGRGHARGDQTVAVLDFRNASGDPSLDYLTKAIPENIITYLGKSGKVAIVERARLQEALGEMKLMVSGVIDEQTAVELGRSVGASSILVGSFVKIEDIIRINARLIDVQTGEIITAEQVQGRAGKEIFQLMDQTAEAMQQRLVGMGGETLGIQPLPVGTSFKPGKPIYKRWWFWAIVAAGIGGGIAATQLGKEDEGPGEIGMPPDYPQPLRK